MSKNNWREEFDEKWAECNCAGGFDYGQCSAKHYNKGQIEAKEDIKSFIEKTLEAQRNEIIAMCEGMKQECDLCENQEVHDTPYNQAIQDIITKLKENKNPT